MVIETILGDILISLIGSGVYYAADRHREWLDQKRDLPVQTRQQIQESLETGLKTTFPAIAKKLDQLGLDEEQARKLKDLLSAGDHELEVMLQEKIAGELYNLSTPTGLRDGDFIDMFSVDEIAKVLKEINDRKKVQGLKKETITFAAPRLIVLLLQEITYQPALKEIFALIREIQNARFREAVLKYITLNEKTELGAVNEIRHKLHRQAADEYAITLAGKEPDFVGRFDYLPPGLRLVQRENGRIPLEFDSERYSTHLDEEELFRLIREKKRVLVVAGAGVGKTTFMLHLQLEMLKKRLKDAPLPIFQNTDDFIKAQGGLVNRTTLKLAEAPALGFDPVKAAWISGALNHHGLLCFILDSLDQTADFRGAEQYFLIKATEYLGNNAVILACRGEQIKRDPEKYRSAFHGFEWVILDKFSREQLEDYLGPVLNWLQDDCCVWEENFIELLRTRFYANIAKRIGIKPAAELSVIRNRTELLDQFMDELFREASSRGQNFSKPAERNITNFLHQLSFDTLAEEKKQWFPLSFMDRYTTEQQNFFEFVIEEHWIFSNRIFEGRNVEQYTFYHQLLQEYFAARKMSQELLDDMEAFNRDREALKGMENSSREKALEDIQKYGKCLKYMTFSDVILDFLDEMLPDREVFYFCMGAIEMALALADLKKTGLSAEKNEEILSTGDKFTWLLALRGRKGEKPELESDLQGIFDKERAASQIEAESDGKFVKIPAGAFLMGGYEYAFEQPVRVVYLSDYWISIYAETFEEYDRYSQETGMIKSKDKAMTEDRRPVTEVSWKDAQEYIKLLYGKYCLPTEAQWEKAARGCLGRRYPWGNKWDQSKVNSRDSEHRNTIEVENYRPEMYGLFQMSGNVWEWCEDRYGDYPLGSVTDPTGPSSGSYRVDRGGGWLNNARICRSATRIRHDPDNRFNDLGFRLARIT